MRNLSPFDLRARAAQAAESAARRLRIGDPAGAADALHIARELSDLADARDRADRQAARRERNLHQFAPYLSAVDDLADAADHERDNAAYADILSAYATRANSGD